MRNKLVNKKYYLVLDVGTTGIKAFIFDLGLNIIIKTFKELTKYRPQKKWMEQDPNEIYQTSIKLLNTAIKESNINIEQILGLGLTTQRETVVAWDKRTSQALARAISWQDERTANYCKSLSRYQKMIKEKTGLPLLPYFSASKINWLLTNNKTTKKLANTKSLAIGTLDSWLIWKLTGGKKYLTDYTNASRTLLFNIKTLGWDQELLDVFGIAKKFLPDTLPSQSLYGFTEKKILSKALPILAVAGDQQSSYFACLGAKKGTKITYGTGTFVMQGLGSKFQTNSNFYTTLGCTGDKKPFYILENKISHYDRLALHALRSQFTLKLFLKGLAKQADQIIKKLPLKPKLIIIDGGLTRDGYLQDFQAQISKISLKTLPTFDGTAYGVAALMNNANKVNKII